MRAIYLIAWAVTRLLFLALWSFANPIGQANVWLKNKVVS